MHDRKPISADLRKRVVRAVEKGLQRKNVATRFDVSIASVNRWYRMYKATGSVEPKKNWRKGHSFAITNLKKFKIFVEQNNGLTQQEMADKWGGISAVTMGVYLKKIGFTKKNSLYFIKNVTKKKEFYIKRQLNEKSLRM